MQSKQDLFELQVFRFHARHGPSIKISNNHLTAESTCCTDDLMVMSRDIMQVDRLYEVSSHSENVGHTESIRFFVCFFSCVP